MEQITLLVYGAIWSGAVLGLIYLVFGGAS